MEQAVRITLPELLDKTEFISIASADREGKVNAAPKFLLKIEGRRLFIVDCVMGKTWENIKVNHRVSIPVMDISTLVGYSVNGNARIIPQGSRWRQLRDELSRKQITLSTQRIIEGIKKEKIHPNLEVSFPDKVGIFVVTVEEIVRIGPTGSLVRARVAKEKP